MGRELPLTDEEIRELRAILKARNCDTDNIRELDKAPGAGNPLFEWKKWWVWTQKIAGVLMILLIPKKIEENLRYYIPKTLPVYEAVQSVMNDIEQGSTDPNQFAPTLDYIVNIAPTTKLLSTDFNDWTVISSSGTKSHPTHLPERTVVASSGTMYQPSNSLLFRGPFPSGDDLHLWS